MKRLEDLAAWDEPVFNTIEKSISNVCGADVAGNTSAHAKEHALAGDGGGHHSEWEQIQTGTIHHDATGHYVQVQVQAAYGEKVQKWYICSTCRATK